jgi:hypothetical protein
MDIEDDDVQVTFHQNNPFLPTNPARTLKTRPPLHSMKTRTPVPKLVNYQYASL